MVYSMLIFVSKQRNDSDLLKLGLRSQQLQRQSMNAEWLLYLQSKEEIGLYF